jgi:hypothetical protein
MRSRVKEEFVLYKFDESSILWLVYIGGMGMSKIKFMALFLMLACLPGCLNSSKEQILMFSQNHDQGYVEVKDGKLFYQTFGFGEPIIVLHGGPGMDQGYLLPQMLELAKEHKVTFYDQRGSGKSLDTKIDEKTITINQFGSFEI